MSLVREDGLIIRDLKGNPRKTFIQNGVFYQFCKAERNNHSIVETISFDGFTQYSDQYLIMPRSIFDIWSKE